MPSLRAKKLARRRAVPAPLVLHELQQAVLEHARCTLRAEAEQGKVGACVCEHSGHSGSVAAVVATRDGQLVSGECWCRC